MSPPFGHLVSSCEKKKEKERSCTKRLAQLCNISLRHVAGVALTADSKGVEWYMGSLAGFFFFPTANESLISLARRLCQAAGSRKSEDEPCRIDKNSDLIRLKKKEKWHCVFLLGG